MDKILIGNNKALQQKYPDGSSLIHDAVNALIRADAERGLETQYVAVDDPAMMAAFGCSAVLSADDQRGNKEAIDAIWKKSHPDYIVLIGAPDIIPHQFVNNPVFKSKEQPEDTDTQVPSDLPYACLAPYSQDIGDFQGPVRVVTRLPDVMSQKNAPPGARIPNPQDMVQVLANAASAIPLTFSDYSSCLGVSHLLFHNSTEANLKLIFGESTTVQDVFDPKREDDIDKLFQWPPDMLDRKSHFFNCDGATVDSQYIGDNAVAHDAAFVIGKIKPGTVMAAECCYGAELFAPDSADDPVGMANAYMLSGAYAFWGSTTIAYSPKSGNQHADLMCRFFFEEILKGASVGHAALAARQRYVQQEQTLNGVALKTLAQFIILGDASIHCIQTVTPESAVFSEHRITNLAPEESRKLERRSRRKRFWETGLVLQQFSPRIERIDARSPEIQQQLENLSSQMVISNSTYLSHKVLYPASANVSENFREVEAAFPKITAFHLIFDTSGSNGPKGRRVVEVSEFNGQIGRIRELYQR